MFRWGALEAQQSDFGDLSGFGVYTGDIDGVWGVSTLNTNPISGQPYVRMFSEERDAVAYARSRAAKGPLLYYPRQPGQVRPVRNEKARIYYVVSMPKNKYDAETGERAMLLAYRVLRGHLSGKDPQQGVLVFEHTKRIGDKDHWKLKRSLSIAENDPNYPTARARKPR
jgi:hypothetical protein